LEQLEFQENYGPILLLLCNKNDLNMNLRMVSSIAFKNYIKRNWRVNEEEGLTNKICDNDRLQIKASIIELMLTNPEQIQRQLSDAISIISREDFPDKWQDLLNGMVDRLKSGDFHIINGVLRTAHSIFRR
jgi:exportin-2 (importin alpha re-exporter)